MKTYRLKPLIKKMCFDELVKTCKKENWLIPTAAELMSSDVEYDSVWIRSPLHKPERFMDKDDSPEVRLGLCYSVSRGKAEIVNKNFMMHCVVLVEKRTYVGKPKLRLTGVDGNVFNVIGKAKKAVTAFNRQQSDPSKMIDFDEIQREALEGDYDHVIQTLMKHFEIS